MRLDFVNKRIYIYISLSHRWDGMPLSDLSITREELEYIHKVEGKGAR